MREVAGPRLYSLPRQGCNVNLRFLVSEGAAGETFRDAVHADIQRSRLSWKYRAYYSVVRPLLPLRLRQRLQGRMGTHADLKGLYPDQFMARLSEAVGADGGIDLIHPWPKGLSFGFALTHDVESAAGLKRSLQVASVEEERGFRSSFNVVPHGYPVDRGIIRELVDRGFEIGIHGYNHDGRLFISRSRFRARTPYVNSALADYGAVGFRSPMAHRNLDWMQDLDIRYDGSCFDADPFQAMSCGVGSVWPFVAGQFIEMPYTLPQDHTVFIVLGRRDGSLWSEKLGYLRKCSALVSMLTHPDYLDSSGRMEAYARFLEEVAETENHYHALPRTVADWWRARDRSGLERGVDGSLRVTGPAAEWEGVPARLTAIDGMPVFRAHETGRDGGVEGCGTVVAPA